MLLSREGGHGDHRGRRPGTAAGSLRGRRGPSGHGQCQCVTGLSPGPLGEDGAPLPGGSAACLERARGSWVAGSERRWRPLGASCRAVPPRAEPPQAAWLRDAQAWCPQEASWAAETGPGSTLLATRDLWPASAGRAARPRTWRRPQRPLWRSGPGGDWCPVLPWAAAVAGPGRLCRKLKGPSFAVETRDEAVTQSVVAVSGGGPSSGAVGHRDAVHAEWAWRGRAAGLAHEELMAVTRGTSRDALCGHS